MKIQNRDLDVLRACQKYGLLSTNQIAELHFKNLHPTTLMRRLKILADAKLLVRIDSLPNNQSAWSLGREGALLIRAGDPPRFTNRNTTLHDVTLSGVRMDLERMGLGENFSTEMELKKRINWKLDERKKDNLQVPDGIFTARSPVQKNTLVVALEVELHAKNHRRYRRIVSQYLAKKSLSYVWYFVKSESIARTIRDQYQALPKYDESPKFLFTVIAEAKAVLGLGEVNFPVLDSKTGKWMKPNDYFDLPGRDENVSIATCNPEGRESEFSSGREAA